MIIKESLSINLTQLLFIMSMLLLNFSYVVSKLPYIYCRVQVKQAKGEYCKFWQIGTSHCESQ
jgi:hypothetical protein